MVTLCPSFASSAATVNPAGPAPITATLLPVIATFLIALKGFIALFSLSKSATNRSSLPTETASPFLLLMQNFWHCSSWGQTLPQIAGRLFFSFIFFRASVYFFSLINLINSGISIPTGQPLTHCALGQDRHL